MEVYKLQRARKQGNKQIENTALGTEGNNKCQWGYNSGKFMIGFGSLYTVASRLSCPIYCGLDHFLYSHFLLCVGSSVYIVPREADKGRMLSSELRFSPWIKSFRGFMHHKLLPPSPDAICPGTPSSVWSKCSTLKDSAFWLVPCIDPPHPAPQISTHGVIKWWQCVPDREETVFSGLLIFPRSQLKFHVSGENSMKLPS